MPVLGDLGFKQDLLIVQGATFGPFKFRLTDENGAPINLTGATIRAHLRKAGLSPVLIAAFVITITNALNGEFEMVLPASITASIEAGESLKDAASKYVWDLDIVDSQQQEIRPIYGDVTVHRQVTRT